MVDATKSQKHVRFTLGIQFPIPIGAAAVDCSGKVTASTKLSKTKTAKWSGKLAAVGSDCVATVKARLAAAKHGKKLRFTVAFKGNKKLKSFSRSWLLKVKAPPPPPPPPTPAQPAPPPLEVVGVHNKGSWDINANDNINDDFEFFIKPDYSVAKIFSTAPGEVQLQCESTSPMAKLTFDNGFVAKSDTLTVQSTQNDDFNISMVHTFHFSWTSPISGVGQYSSSGQYNVGTAESPDFENCTGGYSFTLEHFGSVT